MRRGCRLVSADHLLWKLHLQVEFRIEVNLLSALDSGQIAGVCKAQPVEYGQKYENNLEWVLQINSVANGVPMI